MRFRILFVVACIIISGYSSAVFTQYEGADYCIDCHDQQYNDWITSGHHFILMTGQEARLRPLPLPGGKTWDDISYVIGGSKTKSLYLDQQGYFITSSVDGAGQPVAGANQYNLLTGKWSDYHPGEINRTYDCGSCHTTGYEAAGSPAGLPGISGTFALPGVQCERCHGPGLTMDLDSSPTLCGDCHNHGPTDAIAASNGFIRSEGQYNEFLASPHSETSCTSCHNPHKRAEQGIVAECKDCHMRTETAYAGTVMADAGVSCKDCHMPPATLSAQALGPHTGDMKTHIFSINTNPGARLFTQDGDQVELTDGRAAVTLDFVCQRCHKGTSLDELAWFARDFHARRFGISGTVEDNSSTPLADVGIEIRNSNGEHLFELSTGTNGTYRMPLLVDGGYYVQTRDEPFGLGRELYDDHLCLPASLCDESAYVIANATGVVVTGADATGIDFLLERPIGGMMSGQVSDADTGIPLLDIQMTLLDASNAPVAATHTDPQGNYYFSGLSNGVYKTFAETVPQGYTPELFGGDHCPDGSCDLNTSCTPITISGGGVASNRDIILDYTGTRLIGTITRSDTGNPVSAQYAEMGVDLFSESGSHLGTWLTNRAGQFQITLADAGDYYLTTTSDWDYHRLINEAWDDIKCHDTCDPQTAGAYLIPVADGTTVVVNFILDPEIVFSNGFE